MTSTFIQAVPWNQQRQTHALRLALETGAQVVWDSDHSPYRTFLAVHRIMGNGPSILLEDDVLLVDNWRDRIEEVIAQHPDDLARFFTPEEQQGTEWIAGEHFAWNQCVYYPAGMSEDFLAYVGDSYTDFHENYHDLLFARFLHVRRRKFLSYVPSLVQHLPVESSVLSHRRKNRQSPTFVKEAP